ncbi:hypothetical protein JTE90_029066 [Oedothorax gibbosus]|uniref:Transmembrane protein n=1 Tax=Oedothorax gibbosus TaxID=931172 RepID=A0AAV6UV11_9ARAC|nr:hypothetical protein JTE90_029066 [Oedothorax gibbosus]
MAANVHASVCGAYRRPSFENRIVFLQHETNQRKEQLCVRTCGFGILMFVFIGCMILFTTWLNLMEGKPSDSLNIPAACIFFVAAALCTVYVSYKECSHICMKKRSTLLIQTA